LALERLASGDRAVKNFAVLKLTSVVDSDLLTSLGEVTTLTSLEDLL